MDPSSTTTTNSKSSLFQVYLRLRPPQTSIQQLYPTLPKPDRFLIVEEPTEEQLEDGAASPTHITLNPPNDNRRRAVEKFAFTRVFDEESSQLDVFHGTGVLPLVEGVLGPNGGGGRDGLLATLGVTGSGKVHVASHTILGSRNQRGLTQLALDVLFRSIDNNILDVDLHPELHGSISSSDPSEAQVMSAQMFLDTYYFDPASPRASSRAPTPQVVRVPIPYHPSPTKLYPYLPPFQTTGSPKSIRIVAQQNDSKRPGCAPVPIPGESTVSMTSYIPSFMQATATAARKMMSAKTPQKGDYYLPTPRRTIPTRPSAMPSSPDITGITVDVDHHAEYAVLISMYEVYNDRIFDLLMPAASGKSANESRRRSLLFKPTEQSPERKVVAGLRKIICGSIKDALMVLEAGLNERRVAVTNSNSTSSRSHGFFCVEVKKRRRSRTPGPWAGSSLTVVDLAGSERARDAKTAGATLAEAGKINESLMYLGQCLQMQSDLENNAKPNLVPFRQCKLTELLFSNSFPSTGSKSSSTAPNRNPQRAIMIVTADPLGDFNATSQILRYSALAKEITVPRVPSITATILRSSQSSDKHPSLTSPTSPTYARFRHHGPSQTPTETERETMEIAALEIARMSEEIDGLRRELERETRLRMESEAHLQSMEDRMLDLEMDIREECYDEMERRIEEEARKWMVRLEEHGEREEEWRNRKVEVLVRGLNAGIGIGLDEDKENRNSDAMARLEMENAKLLREVERLKRELNNKSPTKPRQPSSRILKESRTHVMDKSASPIPDNAEDHGLVLRESMAKLRVDDDDEVEVVRGAIGKLRIKKSNAGTGSPTKRVRQLTTRKWDIGDDDL
ncbi:hypothetical protein DSL72_003542 [Monilinia vaccinii-corymbosi]|uniref:Kinesin-like protein n=1 Tax=Monilinia vaccinii-corymbosi TaxID=61207 RepID=A0A8A3NX33_9HELO|nr:hypothetical protein DSL72_003542 [Monilinia vaccinii-corymbosi]